MQNQCSCDRNRAQRRHCAITCAITIAIAIVHNKDIVPSLVPSPLRCSHSSSRRHYSKQQTSHEAIVPNKKIGAMTCSWSERTQYCHAFTNLHGILRFSCVASYLLAVHEQLLHQRPMRKLSQPLGRSSAEQRASGFLLAWKEPFGRIRWP